MAKGKSITELRDEKSQLKTRSAEIVASMRKEARQATDPESRELADIQARMVEINMDIDELAEANRGAGKRYGQPVEKFSLRRAICAQMDHRQQRDVEAQAIEDATRLHSSISASLEGRGDLIIPMQTRAAYTATTEATTGVLVDEEQMEMLLPLESNLVLANAGIRMLTGLRGNIYWPKHSAVAVSWEGENDEAPDGAGDTSKGKIYAPKRLTAKIDISKQLLVQENRSVEGLIRQLIAVAIAQKIEKTAFSTAAHADDVPDGLFQVTPTAVTGAMSWEQIVKMETTPDLANALMGNLAYIMHPSLLGKSKTKVKDASGAGGFVLDAAGNGLLNGYKALRTNNIPSGLQADGDEFGIVFANWADYFLGQWGAIDMTVDPYTQASKGMIRLVVNSYWNMGAIRDESFCIGSMK